MYKHVIAAAFFGVLLLNAYSGGSKVTELKIIDSKVGEGDAVKEGDRIQVHYTGWLYVNGERGEQFDSSFNRNEPFEFAVGVDPLIEGWTTGVVGMKPGGKRELIIPPALGYESRDLGVIPPNSTLDFEIELLKILK